ncbi:hypothetical protein ACT21L_000091 [Vibrio vulnificus]|nr:hypothetical protein [Vibrio vulnificus]ELI3521906.1 hypothetical protein [Vibrio vulnificus]
MSKNSYGRQNGNSTQLLGRTGLDQMKLEKPASIATIALKGKALDSIIILACYVAI